MSTGTATRSTRKASVVVNHHSTKVEVVGDTPYGSSGSYTWAPGQPIPSVSDKVLVLSPTLINLLRSIQNFSGSNVTQVTITYNHSGFEAAITCPSEESAHKLAAALRERGSDLIKVTA